MTFNNEIWVHEMKSSLAFGCFCPHKNVKIKSDEKQEIFAHELQSALKLTVGFSNIYCEM